MTASGRWDPGRLAWREICRNADAIWRTRCGVVVAVHVDGETFAAICSWATYDERETLYLDARPRGAMPGFRLMRSLD